MNKYKLKIKLLSDTTFGRGDGVAGLVDQEVEHDAYGLPYLRGRTLKGLLSEECDNLIHTLVDNQKHWQELACKLFGISGSGLDIMAAVHIGDARLPSDLQQAVAHEIQENDLTSQQILSSLTTIRKQTAISAETGVAEAKSLRSARVVIRDLEFTSDLLFETETVEEDMLTLLAIGTLSLRHLGSGRNRGRGHVQCTLHDADGNDITRNYIHRFGQEVKNS
ncbi:MAG: RAMP superfamily protein [Pseudanabaena sp. M57BS1SP1A06MG]|nr:RAMP superfamily protein [Pseudanabaena sp. M53BS1SP1A06MG]MCA6582042.1 RAMP superfamily protein [Pseudanabaena sp. M34BS1SP1A06MG]MCA6594711.1 RAMP superfamily protein [Pseudanabaena sp. M38BS1SP1A06MG]MCA6602855.1 RAMP superfamily protein [Pseudanabaena sp. M57BS1SP1A06MG]